MFRLPLLTAIQVRPACRIDRLAETPVRCMRGFCSYVETSTNTNQRVSPGAAGLCIYMRAPFKADPFQRDALQPLRAQPDTTLLTCLLYAKSCVAYFSMFSTHILTSVLEQSGSRKPPAKAPIWYCGKGTCRSYAHTRIDQSLEPFF